LPPPRRRQDGRFGLAGIGYWPVTKTGPWRARHWGSAPFAEISPNGDDHGRIISWTGKRREAMRRIILESPYAGEVERNVQYARACVRDCLKRGEAPIASHLLFTQPGILRDGIAEERALGVSAGLAWIPVADAMAVYVDHGVSPGVRDAMELAKSLGLAVEERKIL
jgi:hypothetical protein